MCESSLDEELELDLDRGAEREVDGARDVVRGAVRGREAAAALEVLERLHELDEVALLERRRGRREPLADLRGRA